MKLKYNAFVTLSFTFLCIGILAVKDLAFPYLIRDFFTVPSHTSFVATKTSSYFLLFSHVLGHSDWGHLFANISFILLLGPLLEENYGSFILFVMIVTTAFVTGVLNICFSSQALLGSSGIVFMMILLSSFTNTDADEIPLSFLLVLALFLIKDVFTAVKSENISQFAHLVGGACGSLFGFLRPSGAKNKKTTNAKYKGRSSLEEKD